MTLVELTVSLAALLIIFTMTVPIVDTLFSTIARVNNTYVNVNQLLPVSTNLQRFIRSAVEPGPMAGGVPAPAFVTGAVSPTSMTLYTNIGDPNGPAEIVASCTSSNPSSGLCDPGATFTVTEARATANSCPPTGSGCTWRTPQTLIIVYGVSNANDGAALFVYSLLVINSVPSGTTETLSQVGVDPPYVYPTGAGCSSPSPSCYASSDQDVFASCTSAPSPSGNVLGNCPSAEVYAVTIDLQVLGCVGTGPPPPQTPACPNGVSSGRTAGGQSEADTTVYLISPVSSQYQPMVG
ncbi:MAG: PulJ/GspJ family protein [Acidimicrobiales bacterium]